MKKLALISEGISEINVIRTITERYYNDDDIVINPVQPTEAGGKQTSYGGWLGVLNYCTDENFREIFRYNPHGLIIQIDTDCCDKANYDVKKTKEDNTQKTDEELYDEIVKRIFKNISPEVYQKYKEKIIFAICFEEIECWFLPVYYNDKMRCDTNNCIRKVNKKTQSKNIEGIPEDHSKKNSPEAQRAYNKILKNFRKPADIKKYSQYNLGFSQFINQLDTLKSTQLIGNV